MSLSTSEEADASGISYDIPVTVDDDGSVAGLSLNRKRPLHQY